VAGKLTRVFGYRAGKTVLHRMPAGLKLAGVIIISAVAFVSPYGLAVSVLLVLAACAAARIRPYTLLKGSKPLVVISLFIILVKTIRPEAGGITIHGFHISFISTRGFFEGLLTAPGLFVPFASAGLLFGVTTMRELRLSLALVEKKIVKILFPGRGRVPFLSLGISLMLGFIPRFFEMWDDANTACDARSCKRGPRRLCLLVPLVTERLIEASADTALALEARAFGQGRD